MTAVNLQFAHMNDADAFKSLTLLPVSFSLAGDNVLVSGVVAKRIGLYRVFIVVGGDTNLTFKDGPNTSQSGALPMLANGTFALDISNIPWFQTSAGNDLVLNSSASVQVSGTVYYQQT